MALAVLAIWLPALIPDPPGDLSLLRPLEAVVPQEATEPRTRIVEAATDEGWNDARALRIMSSAIAARLNTYADSTLQGFDAYAEGHVRYVAEFGGDGGEQTVRADQIALEIRWRRNRGSLQTLVGRHRVSWMPTRLRYHVDHLALYLDNFGERIAVGEGQEVRDVLHPVAGGALDFYEYRLVDSLSIRINRNRFRVYRLQVRPRRADSPGVVGTLDVDRDSRAIARMTATFTPASYVDPTVTHVSIELENALVEGRYWLPGAQSVEIRRQLRWMELPFGGTIRTAFRILEYDIDPDPDARVRPGDHVVSLPQAELERYAGWREEEVRITGKGAPEDSARFEAIRRRAVSIAAGRYLGGTSSLRFSVPNVSSGVRYRRAEGVLLGAGFAYQVTGSTALHGWGGYAFERAKPEWAAELRHSVGRGTVRLSGYLERHTDTGPFAAASGVISSLGAAFRGDDYVDPYFADGAAVSVSGPVLGWTATVQITGERQRSAELVAGALGGTEPRPVRPVSDGNELRLDLDLERRLGVGAGTAWSMAIGARLAGGGDFGYSRWILSMAASPPDPQSVWQWEASVGAGIATGRTPEQRLFLIGGRGTAPGYAFRPWAGDRAFYALAAISREIFSPWIRGRVLSAVGWTDLTDVGRAAAERFGATESGGLRPSVGAGLSLLWDVLRLDAARGLDDGRWEWMLSVNPSWRAPL